MLGHAGIGARDEYAPVGQVRPAGPHLLPVDDIAVAVPHRPGAQIRQVRSGRWLGKQLAPGDLALQRRFKEARALLVVAVATDHRQRHAKADADIRPLGKRIARLFLRKDHRLERGAALSAQLLRQRNPGEPAIVQRALPRAAAAHLLGIVQPFGAVHLMRWGMIGQPGAGAGAVFGFFGRVVEIHGLWRPSGVRQ